MTADAEGNIHLKTVDEDHSCEIVLAKNGF